MATPAAYLIRDQNLNTGAHIGGKTDASKSQKKGGGLGGRKPLNDISNSGKPFVLQASVKRNPNRLISIGKDDGASKSAFSFGKEANLSKAQEKKGKVGGRKALGDLTNAAEPSRRQMPKKSHVKNLSAVLEENISNDVMEEGFLHNHQECIKSKRKAMDMDNFLKTVGLEAAELHVFGPTLGAKGSPVKLLEEMPEPLMEDHPQSCKTEIPGYFSPDGGSPKSPRLSFVNPQSCKTEIPGYFSPDGGSPKSPRLSFVNWKSGNDPDFKLIQTPKLVK